MAVLEVTELGVRKRPDSVWCCQPGLVSGSVLTVLSWCHSESPRQSTSRAVTLPGQATFPQQSPWTALSTGGLRSSHLHLINNLFYTSTSNCVQGSQVEFHAVVCFNKISHCGIFDTRILISWKCQDLFLWSLSCNLYHWCTHFFSTSSTFLSTSSLLLISFSERIFPL